MNREKNSSEPKSWLPTAAELFYALMILSAFLAIAVSGTYSRSGGLAKEVIWDPVPLFWFAPGDQIALQSLKSGFLPFWDPYRGLGAMHLFPSGGTYDSPFKLILYFYNNDTGKELYLLARLLAAGLFCFFLARRLRLSFSGALLAGISYMLCGYFREFHGFQELNAEALFPLFLYFIVRLSQKPRLRHFAGLALVGQFMEANPEIMVYYFAYASLVFWGFGLSLPKIQKDLAGSVLKLAIIYSAAMFLTLASMADSEMVAYEYYYRAWHFHPKGFGLLHLPLCSSIGLVSPIFDYWMRCPENLELEHLQMLTFVPGYLGYVTMGLALLAIIFLKKLSRAGLVFAGMSLIIAGIIFGFPGFNLAGVLPLVRYFQHFRYLQPFLALSTAILAGMGLDLLLREKKAPIAALVIAAVMAVWLLANLYIFHKQISANPWILSGLVSMAGGAVLIVAASLFARYALNYKTARIAAVALIAACGLELCLYFNLIYPLNGLDAYKTEAPPAVNFIKGRGSGLYRIYGTDSRIIHPNLAGKFGLSDLRNLTPLYYGEEADLISAINGWSGEKQRIESFLAGGKFYLDIVWEKIPPPALDLLNVRYVLSFHEPGTIPAVNEPEDVLEIKAESPRHVARAGVKVNGVNREGFIMHVASMVRARIAPGKSGLVTMDAGLLEKSECPQSDGVSLSLIQDLNGGKRLVFARTLVQGRDRNWLPIEFEIENTGSELAFASLPGPKDNRFCDFGTWSMPMLKPEHAPGPAEHDLQLIYDREFKVYENRDVMPRVFSVSETKTAADAAEFVAALKNRDPRDVAWLTGDQNVAPSSFSPAKIQDVKEGFGRISFSATSEGPAFLVISNIYYPGFRAWVNGKETRILKVDGALQGIELPKGKSDVLIAFVPVSLRVGLWFRIVLFAVMIVVLTIFRRPGANSETK